MLYIEVIMLYWIICGSISLFMNLVMNWDYTIKIEPRDLWIGLFWDSTPDKYNMYICMAPMVVVYHWKDKPTKNKPSTFTTDDAEGLQRVLKEARSYLAVAERSTKMESIRYLRRHMEVYIRQLESR